MLFVRRPVRGTVARAAAWLTAGLLGCGLVTLQRSGSPAVSASGSQPPSSQGDEQQARATCGGCHAFPPPDILPRQVWRDEFVRMMFIREKRLPPLGPSGVVNRTVQLPPDMEQALPYFTSRAPDHLPEPALWPAVSESPVQFQRRGLSLPDMPGPPAVSNVQLVHLGADRQLSLLATDMRLGLVFTGSPTKEGAVLTNLASIPHPAHVTLADVDKDGIQDLLVGD